MTGQKYAGIFLWLVYEMSVGQLDVSGHTGITPVWRKSYVFYSAYNGQSGMD